MIRALVFLLALAFVGRVTHLAPEVHEAIVAMFRALVAVAVGLLRVAVRA